MSTSILTCARLADAPIHTIITAETVLALLAVVVAAAVYARAQRGQRIPGRRTLAGMLVGYVALAMAAPALVFGLRDTGLINIDICAPAALIQVVAATATVLLLACWLMQREINADRRRDDFPTTNFADPF